VRIQRLAEQLECSIAEICIAYVLYSGLNTAALITVSSLEQLQAAFQAEQIKLTAEQVKYLERGNYHRKS